MQALAMIVILAAFIAFMLGASLGSFINVVIDRAPRGQSIVYPPSHCPHCRRKLEARDLVPVLSFLVLKGRCRYCSAGIPLRLFVVEVACGLSFMAAALTACLMLIK